MKRDCQGCFITLSDFSNAARQSAEDAALRPVNLINGRQFVELFVQHYDLILELLAAEEADELAQKLKFQKTLLPG